MVSAAANLLIRVEAYANVAVLYFVVVAQIAHGLHNLGDAGLVVGAKKGGAVCDDNVLALMVEKLGKLRRA